MMKGTAQHESGSALQRLHFGMGLFLGNSNPVFLNWFAHVVPKHRSVSRVALWKVWRWIPVMDLGFIICLFPLQGILGGSVCLYKVIRFARRRSPCSCFWSSSALWQQRMLWSCWSSARRNGRPLRLSLFWARLSSAISWRTWPLTSKETRASGGRSEGGNVLREICGL